MPGSVRSWRSELQDQPQAGFTPAFSQLSLGHQPVLPRRVVVRLPGTPISGIRRPNLIPLALIVIAVFLALWRLDAAPNLWWDEGWTLCDARSWAELGHYGCLLAGEPAPSILSAAFPVVAPVTLSFQLFGVGILQARMVGLLFTAGALALLYYLTARLHNRSIAVGTLVILLLMPDKWLHPVFVGKQVMGEMPALLFLLAGYTCFYLTLRKSLLFLPLALGFWGIALMTKVQVQPFWTASVGVPLSIALAKRHWRAAALLAAGLIGSNEAVRLFSQGIQLLLRGHTLPRAPVSGLTELFALAPAASTRLVTLAFVLLYGPLILLGLGYATWRWGRNYRRSDLNDPSELVRLMLLTLTGSWFAWYALLSIGWVRYLLPPAFIGSSFVASMLYDLTGGFNLRSMFRKTAKALKTRHFRRQARKAIGAYLLIIVLSFHAVQALRLFSSYFGTGDTSVLQVTRFLNTTTPPDALIETYESELFVFLDRPYHYPPAQLSADLARSFHLGQDVPIEYDPLTADPDYLVVGQYSRPRHLYEPILATGAFRLRQTYGSYEIYERVQ